MRAQGTQGAEDPEKQVESQPWLDLASLYHLSLRPRSWRRPPQMLRC